MGWEKAAPMWDECTYDYACVCKGEAHSFVPVVGLLPALVKDGSGAKPHVFKQRPEKVLVKRTFPSSVNRSLKKGKTTASTALKSVARWEVRTAATDPGGSQGGVS